MKKILLVSDVNNWAWHYKAQEIKENLKGKYHIDVAYTHAVPYYRDIDLSRYDHIHIFGWYSIGEREAPYLKKISTSIASIEYEILKAEKANAILPKITVVAVSEFLYDRLKKKGYRVFPCYNGVNETKFQPMPQQRPNDKFRVGLACKPASTYDLHGYTIIEKLREKLAAYPDIELVAHIANHKTAITHEEMAKFYNTLDVFIHTGRQHLATPNPVFEAAATGVPIIGTTNGCIPLLIKDGTNGYLIDINLSDDEKVAQFVEKIVGLSKNRALAKTMGSAARQEIVSNWTWKQRALDWIPVFENKK